MKEQHTQGEWSVCIGPIVTIGIDGQGAIAEFSETDKLGGLKLDRDKAIANATLCANAPAMLDALKRAHQGLLEAGRIIRQLDENCDYSQHWTQDGDYVHGDEYIRAAIELATGKAVQS